MGLPAQARKTFHDIKTASIPAFWEARRYIEKICTGHIDPAEVQAKAVKAQRLMESRRAQARRAERPAHFLELHGDATVIRRPSGLYVPPKYKDV